MAIALDAVSGGVVSGAGSITVSHTVSGTDRAIVVGAESPNSGDLLSLGTATFNGVSLGAPRVSDATAGNETVAIWVLVAPTLGTHDVVLTPTSGAFIGVAVASFTGVDQTTPVDDVNSTGGSLPSPQSLSVSVSAGGVAVDMIGRRVSGETLTPHGSQTQISTQRNDGVGAGAASFKAGATAMEWTYPSTAAVAHCVVALKAATASGVAIDPAAGTLAVTGPAPTIVRTGNVALVPAAGALTITGPVPTVVSTVTATFTTEEIVNDTGTGYRGSESCTWTWITNGDFGDLENADLLDGSGTTDSGGTLTVTVPAGAGVLVVEFADGGRYYEAGTAA